MKYNLADICEYAKGKVDVAILDADTYISTENMMPNKRGITSATSLPTVAQTQAFLAGDILVSNIRPYFKKIWFAEFNGGCSNDVLVFRAKNGVSKRFLYYVLANDTFFDYSMSTSKGTKMPRGDKAAIMKYDVPDFTYEKQEKIAGILDALDKKIQLNTEINNNLEQQAMAIFNNAIQQSKSVTYVKLGSFADVKCCKCLPKGANLMSIPNSHPYIRVRDLNDVVFASLSTNYEYVDDETQKAISRYITTTDDVLISIVGTIGLTAIVDKSLNMANLTENCVKVTNLHGISPEYLLLYLRSQHGSEEIKKGTVGAVQAKLPIKNIQALSVPLLPQSDLQSLNDTLKILFNQLSINIAESKCLTDIRDLLLPKLMSGKLDVSDLDL